MSSVTRLIENEKAFASELNCRRFLNQMKPPTATAITKSGTRTLAAIVPPCPVELAILLLLIFKASVVNGPLVNCIGSVTGFFGVFVTVGVAVETKGDTEDF